VCVYTHIQTIQYVRNMCVALFLLLTLYKTCKRSSCSQENVIDNVQNEIRHLLFSSTMRSSDSPQKICRPVGRKGLTSLTSSRLCRVQVYGIADIWIGQLPQTKLNIDHSRYQKWPLSCAHSCIPLTSHIRARKFLHRKRAKLKLKHEYLKPTLLYSV
jgi:hypothetical protein